MRRSYAYKFFEIRIKIAWRGENVVAHIQILPTWRSEIQNEWVENEYEFHLTYSELYKTKFTEIQDKIWITWSEFCTVYVYHACQWGKYCSSWPRCSVKLHPDRLSKRRRNYSKKVNKIFQTVKQIICLLCFGSKRFISVSFILAYEINMYTIIFLSSDLHTNTTQMIYLFRWIFWLTLYCK